MLTDACPTGKRCFSSHTEAETTMRFIKTKGKSKNQGTLRRPYRCPTCAWWHLSSWVSRDNWWD